MNKLITGALVVLAPILVATAANADSFAAKPCSLLRDTTVSTVFHQPMAVAPAELAHTPNQCAWTSGGKSLIALAETPGGLTLQLRLEHDGSGGWQRNSERLDHPGGSSGTPIAGLGDRAVWVAHSFLGPEIVVQRGGSIVDLQVTAADVSRKDAATVEQMQILAKEVLSRL
jgi:hypothetical protein